MTTKGLRQLSLAGCAVLCLVACGQKGALYIPTEKPQKPSENQKVEAKDGSESASDKGDENSVEGSTKGAEQ